VYFVLITETSLVSESDLYKIAKDTERNVGDCAQAWGRERPAVDVIHAKSALPDFCQPILFVDDDTLDPGALAVHYWDPVRLGPAGRVFVNRCDNILIPTGHELCEALVDPQCNLWSDAPSRPGVQIALEICDPVQDAYVNGANFVLPAYFGGPGDRWDWAGRLPGPGSIGPNGYAIFQDNTHRWTEGYTEIRRNGRTDSRLVGPT
jgi:hypothetical protein